MAVGTTNESCSLTHLLIITFKRVSYFCSDLVLLYGVGLLMYWNIIKLSMRNSGYFYSFSHCESVEKYKENHKPYICVLCKTKKLLKILLQFIKRRILDRVNHAGSHLLFPFTSMLFLVSVFYPPGWDLGNIFSGLEVAKLK